MSNFLYPVQNAHRSVLSLDGIWQVKIDSKNEGRAEGWQHGLSGTVDMAVPSSYNDIFTEKELRDHCGDVWYESSIFVPEEWRNKDVFVRGLWVVPPAKESALYWHFALVNHAYCKEIGEEPPVPIEELLFDVETDK